MTVARVLPAVGLGAAALVVALLPLGPAAAITAYGVDAVSVTPGPHAVSGFGTASATVSVTLHDSDGVSAGCDEAGVLNGHVGVTLTRTTGAPTSVELLLTGVSGDGKSGTWAGEWRIGSTRSGTWVVSSVRWCTYDMAQFEATIRSVDPRVSPGITATTTVVGTKAPTVLRQRVPVVAAWKARQWLTLTYRDAAGRALAGRAVRVGSGEAACGLMSFGDRVVRTDASGRIALRLYPKGSRSSMPVCAYLTVPAGADPALATTTVLRTDLGLTRYERYAGVSLALPASPVAIGSVVPLQGGVGRATGHVVAQRLVGRTWRAVTSARIRENGRYTVEVRALRGAVPWRVVASDPAAGYAPTPSRTVVVVGR